MGLLAALRSHHQNKGLRQDSLNIDETIDGGEQHGAIHVQTDFAASHCCDCGGDFGEWEFWKKADSHPDLVRQKDLKTAEAKRVKNTQPSLPLPILAGRYECDLYGEFVVSHSDGNLLFAFGRNGPSRSIHWEHNTFYIRSPIADVPTDDWLVSFQIQAERATSLSVRRIGWHESMPRFDRVPATASESTDQP